MRAPLYTILPIYSRILKAVKPSLRIAIQQALVGRAIANNMPPQRLAVARRPMTSSEPLSDG